MKAVDPLDYVAGKFSLFLENFAKMFAAMSSEEKSFLETLKNSEAALCAEMAQMNQLWQQRGATGFGKGGGKGNGDERGRALFNRKGFGLVDKFDGNQSKFKSWLFDLQTAMGSVDQT